jgi:LacI family transcriptional regulator
MKITLKDIAREAGVSVSMVSYVLNKNGRAVLESHKRILEIARKYNYVPDANARGLVTGISNNIGLVVPQSSEMIFAQPFMVKCLSEFGKNLTEYSGWLSLCLGDELNAVTLRKYLGNAKLDGIIFMYADDADELAELITARRTPCIFFDRVSACGSASSIRCDEYAGIKMVMNHLLDLGHESILFISGKESAEDSFLDRRLAAYSGLVKENGLPSSAVLYGNFTKQGSYTALKAYLENRGDKPDAIVAANDKMAWGALKLLAEKHINVPRDVSVVGFDDADEEYNGDIGLTTVRQPVAQMAKFCVDYIYECLNAGELQRVEVVMEPELIVRSTTARREI